MTLAATDHHATTFSAENKLPQNLTGLTRFHVSAYATEIPNLPDKDFETADGMECNTLGG